MPVTPFPPSRRFGHAKREVVNQEYKSPDWHGAVRWDQLLQHPPPARIPARPARPRHHLHNRPKAVPGDRSADTHDRVRTDKIGTTGTVTLRHGGKLYHIGIGRAHAGTDILLLVQDLHVRIIAAATGELLRELTLDPSRNYQPTGKPRRPKPKTP